MQSKSLEIEAWSLARRGRQASKERSNLEFLYLLSSLNPTTPTLPKHTQDAGGRAWCLLAGWRALSLTLSLLKCRYAELLCPSSSPRAAALRRRRPPPPPPPPSLAPSSPHQPCYLRAAATHEGRGSPQNPYEEEGWRKRSVHFRPRPSSAPAPALSSCKVRRVELEGGGGEGGALRDRRVKEEGRKSRGAAILACARR